jgi:hypothetical protein
VDVGGVEIAALEVLVEHQNMLLVDKAGEHRGHWLVQVVQYVLRSVGLINFFAECFLIFGVNLDVVPRLSQILRTVAVVNLVPEQVSKFCIVDWVLCLYLDFFSVSQVLVLHILILCFWF